VSWLAYEAPQPTGLFDPGSTLLGTAAGERGGEQPAGFVDGITAARADDPHVTVIGHSYGSLVAGEAAQRTGGIDEL
jgi:pimeloyl-ACP methyl ester carboxylesterase